jgi:5-methyltetrahydropteroyltriglutamate--homocysteine methyltransferase
MAETATNEITSGRRTKPPFRADHVGSLLRPKALLDARDQFANGQIDADELRGVEDEAIREVVQMQHDVGLQSATDGEFRRATWHMDFIYQIGGIEKAPGDIKIQFHNEQGDLEFKPAAIHTAERVHLAEPIFAEDFTFVQSLVSDDVTPKLTIPSPSMVHYRGGSAAIDRSVYPDLDDFWSDLTGAYADEVQAIYDLGGRYLQFDDTSLAYLNDPKQRAEMAGKGEDAADMTVTTHMCRGNYRSSWVAEGGYDFVAEALFGELSVDGFFLEYDDARSGGFEPLRFVPKDKLVVLGLVTTKRPELESKDTLKRRIEEASKFVPVEQICISPQCGFSSTVEGNVVTYDDEVAKLRLLVETASEVWG